MAEIRIEQFDYILPDELIAARAIGHRDTSRLLKYRDGEINDHVFSELPDLLPSGSLMIFNNTKVIPARLFFRKPTGALIEILMLESAELNGSMELSLAVKGKAIWKCMIGNARKWKAGTELLHQQEDFWIKVVRVPEQSDWVQFEWNPELTLAEVLNKVGKLALPPYMNRQMMDEDNVRYQTVYASIPGAIAAPTAGLHFSESVMSALSQKNICSDYVTLHVGAGTFQPVECEEVVNHSMHREYFEVPLSTLESLRHSDFTVAVGTTSLRTLESLYWLAAESSITGKVGNSIDQFSWQHLPADLKYSDAMELLLDHCLKNHLDKIEAFTQIMILPGYRIKSAQALVTNFHLPKSTLLMLVEAAIGKEWKRIYTHAIQHQYRFLSYGDSSLLYLN